MALLISILMMEMVLQPQMLLSELEKVYHI